MSGPLPLDRLRKSWTLETTATVQKGSSAGAPATLVGLASVDGDDHSREQVDQYGLNWDYFLTDGFLKWRHETPNHVAGPDDFVCIPKSVEIVKLEDGTLASQVTGEFRDTDRAREVISLAKDLAKHGRSLGLSIEGGISARESPEGKVAYLYADGKWRDENEQEVASPGKRIVQGVVIDVAIDPHPCHPRARATVDGLRKSLVDAMVAGYPAPAPPDERGAGAPLMPQSITSRRIASRVARVRKSLGEDSTAGQQAVLAASVRRDHYEEERQPLSAELLQEIRKALVGEIDGYRVWLVDGDVIASEVDNDWTAGGNPARYAYVPLDEIWLEQRMSPVGQAATCVHEYVEVVGMRADGLDYDTAHDQANGPEHLLRWTFRHGVLDVTDPVRAARDWLELDTAEDRLEKAVQAVQGRYPWMEREPAEALAATLTEEMDRAAA